MIIEIDDETIDRLFEARYIADVKYLRDEITRNKAEGFKDDAKDMKKMLKGAKMYAKWCLTYDGYLKAFGGDE